MIPKKSKHLIQVTKRKFDFARIGTHSTSLEDIKEDDKKVSDVDLKEMKKNEFRSQRMRLSVKEIEMAAKDNPETKIKHHRRNSSSSNVRMLKSYLESSASIYDIQKDKKEKIVGKTNVSRGVSMLAQTVSTDLLQVMHARAMTTEELEALSELAYIGHGVIKKRRQISGGLSDADIRKVFKEFDIDENNSLNYPELRACMRYMGIPIGTKDAKEYVEQVKNEKQSSIGVDVDTFIQVVKLGLEGQFDRSAFIHTT